MKKAILIVSIVVLLALLAAPVVGQALFAKSRTDHQMAPRLPGTTRNAEKELDSPMLIARIGCRAP
jgi:flagellar basal body-associated protein FliL